MNSDGTKVIAATFSLVSTAGSTLGAILYSEDGGQTFQLTNAPRSHFFQPATVFCDAEFKMCSVALNVNAGYDWTSLLTSCGGGKTWSENPGVKNYRTGVKVSADGGLIYATGEFPRFISAFPL